MDLINGTIMDKLGLVWPFLLDRLAPIGPLSLFLLLVVAVGIYEGNLWRRGRLYAGYYRMIFYSAALGPMVVVSGCAVWLVFPTVVSIQTMGAILVVPSFFAGWALAAGRPVMR